MGCRRFGLFCVFAVFAQFSKAQNVVDSLVVALVEKHLPVVLHQEQATPWHMGTYDLSVSKNAGAIFSSTHRYLSLTLPIKVVMTGQVNREFLGQKVLLSCETEFLTQARLDIEPTINPPQSKANSEISVPIPNVELNCEGLRLPIKPVLEQLVARKKGEWQQQIEQQVVILYRQLGI